MDIPRHIAFIMDGNGRWARERGLARTAGHRAGIDRVKEIIKAASELKVEVVTFFAFSSENWSRPRGEIQALMRYLELFLERQIREFHRNNMRLVVIGRDEPLSKRVLAKLADAQKRTADNTGLTVALALNYGARQEILDAVKKICLEVSRGAVEPGALTEEDFGRYLYTAGLPDPDLLIRTSGEMRLSNFLLWQASYAEFFFSQKHWPDFGRDDLIEAIKSYRKRERRFGGVPQKQ
ncbi:MAG: isoprenyl transferase [Candidatus Omnitrophica bacterium]|nr:isoprenyl transferase [Candidatus Omnitrophota bacterium]